MKNDNEFFDSILFKYKKRKAQRQKRRTILCCSTAAVLMLAMVVGVSARFNQTEPPIDPQPEQPKLVTADPESHTGYSQDSGELKTGTLQMDWLLREALDDPSNEGAHFRVLVYTMHNSDCYKALRKQYMIENGIDRILDIPIEFNSTVWREHQLSAIEQKVSQLTANGMRCEIATNMYNAFYMEGTKGQIETIHEEHMDMGYYLWLALPWRPDGYDAVYSDNLAAILDMADNTDLIRVSIVPAWDNYSCKNIHTQELFNADRCWNYRKGIDIINAGKVKRSLSQIGKRYGGEEISTHVLLHNIPKEFPVIRDYSSLGHPYLGDLDYPPHYDIPQLPYDENFLIQASLGCTLTKENILKLAADSEIRYVDTGLGYSMDA